MNIEINVDKIYSYQTLIYKNGFKTFKKAEYLEYARQITSQLPNIKIEDEGCFKVNLRLFFKMPKSYSEKKKNMLKGKYCNNNIDLDNIAKAIIDVVFNFYDINDKNIVDLHIAKQWNEAEESLILLDISNIQEKK